MEDMHYEFELLPLPYDYSALEPYIDTQTMHLHHDKHLKTYVDNLNNALKDWPEFHNFSLEKLIKCCYQLPLAIQTAIMHNAGGVYNHNLYFNVMTSDSPRKPQGILNDAIARDFGSFEKFKEIFKTSALNTFGSGYAWLVSDSESCLKVISTRNQETPLTMGLIPILLIDVWEHAYYLKYQNRRNDYIEAWFNVINWEMALLNYTSQS